VNQPSSDTSGHHRLDPADYLSQLEPAARVRGFRIERYGGVAGHPLLALTKRTTGRRPRVYLSAGVHGNEPAPPLALLHLLGQDFFDARAVWFLCPLLNPAGFARGSRENADGLDLNRDYKTRHAAETRAHVGWLRRQPNFDLAICLHEDWEAGGFYLYELNPKSHRSAARPMLEAVAAVCPIETATVIDGRPIDEPAIIRPLADPNLRELWPESIYLRAHHDPLGYTIETPSALPLATRIAALSAAVAAALKAVS
jgi:hypothetical protein